MNDESNSDQMEATGKFDPPQEQQQQPISLDLDTNRYSINKEGKKEIQSDNTHITAVESSEIQPFIVSQSQNNPQIDQLRRLRRQDYERQRISPLLKQKIKILRYELLPPGVISFWSYISVIFLHSGECNIPLDFWMIIAASLELLDVIIIVIQLLYLTKKREDSEKFDYARYLVLLTFIGWLVYGNVLTYKYLDIDNCFSYLKYGMFIILFYGYWEMFKCLMVSSMLCLAAIYHCLKCFKGVQVPQGIEELYRTKYNSSQFKAQQNCAICLMDFKKDDQIIPLPCDTRHYYHADCICRWLSQNNQCPLCKKLVLRE